MKPFKKILMPTDFSERSSEALRLAADLARRYGARLTLLHVYHVPGYAIPDGYIAPSPLAVTSVLERVELGLAREKLEAERMEVETVITASAVGIPAAEIVRFAEAGGYDVVVMGSHGRTGLKHALLGSVAEHVVRHAPCPVLTVKARPSA